MRVKKAKMQDLDEIVRINQAIKVDIKEADWHTRDYIRTYVEDGCYFLIKEDEKVYGAICIDEMIKNKLQIITLAVKKRSRKKGIGKRLVGFAVKEAKKRGLDSIGVYSLTQYGVKDFYISCGFEKEPGYVIIMAIGSILLRWT